VAEAFYYAWICRYGNCEIVTSDNGTEFAQEFTHMLARLGVKHMHTSACHPAANVAVERLVRSFKEIIAKFVNNHPVHWVRAIPQARTVYMSRMHRAIGVSPFEMLHGCTPKLAVPAAIAIGSLATDEYAIAEYVDSLQQHF
jgi:transposase InsO family protein